MDDTWTLAELVEQVATRIAALPVPKNGQVRAVPDERTVRYYGTIGLLDKPHTMRGRTALYGKRHLAQVVAIKRMQSLGKSLGEIQASWPTLDDETLGRMAGVAVGGKGRAPARTEFWKTAPARVAPAVAPARAPVELRVPLAGNVILSIALPDDVTLTAADLRAIRAAAAPMLDELARRQLATPDDARGGDV